MANANSESNATHETEVREQLRTLRDDFKELGRQLRSAIGSKVHSAAEGGSETLQRGKERLAEYGEDVLDSVRRNPVRSVLIAAAVGALTGLLCRGR